MILIHTLVYLTKKKDHIKTLYHTDEGEARSIFALFLDWGASRKLPAQLSYSVIFFLSVMSDQTPPPEKKKRFHLSWTIVAALWCIQRFVAWTSFLYLLQKCDNQPAQKDDRAEWVSNECRVCACAYVQKGLCQQKQTLLQVPKGALTHGRAHTPSLSHTHTHTHVLSHTVTPCLHSSSLPSSYTSKTVKPSPENACT